MYACVPRTRGRSTAAKRFKRKSVNVITDAKVRVVTANAGFVLFDLCLPTVHRPRSSHLRTQALLVEKSLELFKQPFGNFCFELIFPNLHL